jgi:hypothetical protein
MRTRRINFELISFKKTVRGKCYSCGKKMQRTFSESQTVNPFNKNEHGDVKTRDEIIEDVKQILDDNTENVLFVCKDCEL